MGSLVVGVSFVCSSSAPLQAGPFDKQIEFTQPDGTRIQLHGWGDEFYAVFETLDGYTVVFDELQMAYCFAQQAGNGELVSTGVQTHRGDPAALGLGKRLRMSATVRQRMVLERRQLWEQATQNQRHWDERKAAMRVFYEQSAVAAAGSPSGPQPPPPDFTLTGARVGLTMLIDFSDDPATIPRADIVDFCNADGYTGYGNNGSVKSYFYDNSGGLLTYTNVVTIYIRAPKPKSFYNDTTKDCGSQARLLITDALNTMKLLPNYTTEILPIFTAVTVDGSSYVVAFNVLYAGGNGGRWKYGLWPHSSSLASAQSLSPGGKKVYKYQITNVDSSPTLGTFCHENGHMLCDYPDIYDYDYDSTGGAGAFCLMNSGGHGTNPAQICAYLKRASGWATTTELDTNSALLAAVTATAGANFNHFYRFQKPGLSTEYYLVENRQSTGRDARLPASGIAIWHIDERGHHNNQSTNYNTTNGNYEVTLIQADNQWHFQRNLNSGDACDLYYAGNSATAYGNRLSDTTAPSARWWDGSTSGILFADFSASGATMTFRVGAGPPSPPVITAQPQSRSVAVGATISFSVTATGNPAPSFHWRFYGVPIPGAGSSVLTLRNVQVTNAGIYTVTASNVAGVATSVAAVLTVLIPATIVAQPQDVLVRIPPGGTTLPAGSNATFTVVAAGTGPLKYLWHWTETVVSETPVTAALMNETNATLTVPVSPDSAGGYFVVVSNSVSIVTSAVAHLIYASTLVTPGSVWRYFDRGVGLGPAWRIRGFSDTGWASGPAQLGYGEGDEATVVSFGPVSSNKYVTTYFRHTFEVANPSIFTNLALQLLRDDGAVVYLNGVEVFRSNIETGAVAYSTFAATAVAGSDETAFFPAEVPSARLVAGTNVLAVEVHQCNPTSSDLSFDLELTGVHAFFLPEPAAITPASESFLPGDEVWLHASAVGTRPLYSQWMRNGAVIPGATEWTLHLTNMVLADAGNYVFVVSNRFGSATSEVASLTLKALPRVVAAGSALAAESGPVNGRIDPDEVVTIQFGLRNIGVVNTTNLQAVLLASNGITMTNAATTQTKNYGTLVAGGSVVSKPFTFRAVGVDGGSVLATFLLKEGSVSNGLVTFTYTLGRTTYTNRNANSITINDNSPASPYPSVINVSGLSEPVSKVTVTLYGLSHTCAPDIDMLLVGPSGQNVMLMSDASGGNNSSLDNATITFKDAALFPILETGKITNGAYRPANYQILTDPFPAPGPAASPPAYGTNLAVFSGTDPNGAWKLFIADDTALDSGLLSGGWGLNITTSDDFLPVADLSVNLASRPNPVVMNGQITYTLAVTNHGPGTASNVVVANYLSAGLTFVNASSTVPGAAPTCTGNTVRANVGRLDLKAGCIITILVDAPSSSCLLSDTAIVTGSAEDQYAANNAATVLTAVVDLPAIALRLNASGTMTLSWPTNGGTFILMQAPTLTAPWTDVPSLPPVTVPTTGVKSRFYRLRWVP